MIYRPFLLLYKGIKKRTSKEKSPYSHSFSINIFISFFIYFEFTCSETTNTYTFIHDLDLGISLITHKYYKLYVMQSYIHFYYLMISFII